MTLTRLLNCDIIIYNLYVGGQYIANSLLFASLAPEGHFKNINSSIKSISVTIIVSLIIAAILIVGTFWSGQQAKQDTENAVNSVSLLYLDELAGRSEQVVSSTLERNIRNMQTAVGLLTEDDLSDIEHLQAYQARMKQLYTLEKFAFVDTDGLIYTSLGTLNEIDLYNFDHTSLSEPPITLKDPEGDQKKVIIAIPVNEPAFREKTLVVCFMEIDINNMLEGVSLQSDNNGNLHQGRRCAYEHGAWRSCR